MNFHNLISKDAKTILNELSNNGFKSYLVGGCVRDFLRGTTPYDYDITTDATPEQIIATFNTPKYKIYTLGQKFGTITVVFNHIHYEITTHRKETDYNDNRHPSTVTFTKSILDDLSRRDFTMNAIAYSLTDGLIDPFNGVFDVDNKTIKTVGNATLRFKEDALRMLRAIRFNATLGFAIDNQTINSIYENINLIKNVSSERVKVEFDKFLFSEKPVVTDVLREILITRYPLLKPLWDPDKVNFSLCGFNTASLSLFLLSISKQPLKLDLADVRSLLKSMSYSKKEITSTINILESYLSLLNNNLNDIKKIIYNNTLDATTMAIELHKHFNTLNTSEYEAVISKIIKNNEPLYLKDLVIDGNDLKALGIHDGKLIGDCLLFLLYFVHKKPIINTKQQLIDLAITFKNDKT